MSVHMAEGEVAKLREALHIQHLAMEKLRAELDEERKASASGAHEALSMILRLQEEKAADRMEALQYRRMTEEKIQHGEESLAVLKEVVFLKEMEINTLKYQVQAFKHKLLSAFLRDPYVGEVNIYDHSWSGKSTFLFDKGGLHNIVRRNVSLPVVLKNSYLETGSDGMVNLANVKDKFEVPESLNGCIADQFDKRPIQNLVLGSRNIIKMPRSMHEEDHFEKGSVHVDRWKRAFATSKDSPTDSDLDFTESELQSINCKMQHLEDEIKGMRTDGLSQGKEQLELLTEVLQKVEMIQCHIQEQKQQEQEVQEEVDMQHNHHTMKTRMEDQRHRSSSSKDEYLISYYIEAMLSFSI